MFYNLKKDEKLVLKKPRVLGSQEVYLSELKLSTGELLIVATDKYIEDPISLCAKKWEIETLFGCLKSKGFRFEDTKLKKHERI